MRRIAFTSLVLLAAVGTARAEDFAVTSADVAGKASVEDVACMANGDTKVKVSVTFSRFGEKDNRIDGLALSGLGSVSKAGVLEWSYERRKKTIGIIRFFDRFRDEVPTETVPVRMTRDGNKGWKGTIEGVAQTWQPRDKANEDKIIVLAVPGLSTNMWNQVGIPYMDENVNAIQARGIEARRLAIKTEDSVAKNAAFIAAEIRKEKARGKRVILFAHSKGATDTTAAIALNPDLIPSVAGLVAIQPVYGGSPIADLVGDSAVLTGVVKIAFEGIFKGQKDAVIDLTHDSRKKFVAEHPYPADKVPTVVLRSTFDRKFGSRSVLFANQKLIEKKWGQPSDGMVIPVDQSIPGALATIDLTDLDHFEPGVRVESPHKPADITNRLMGEILPRIRK